MAPENNGIKIKTADLAWVAKAIYFGGAVVAMMALWAGRLQWRMGDMEKAIDRLEASMNVGAGMHKSNEILLKNLQFQIETNTKELKERGLFIDRVNEMWFMKEHGRDNSADYQEKHGKAPIP